MVLSRFRIGPAPPEPDRPVWLVGDIHGRADLLDRLLDRIAGDAGDLVLLGDYVDRGPESLAVLERLSALSRGEPGRVTCLRGNHEQMMLDFLDAPATQGPRWLANGGDATLASFGIAGASAARLPETTLFALAERLSAALPRGLEGWLRRLPWLWTSGTLAAAHAGADPALPLSLPDQDPDALLWGHPAFRSTARRDGIWVAHGHWIVEHPVALQGRIALDTGAWRTGRLSAARLGEGAVRFTTA